LKFLKRISEGKIKNMSYIKKSFVLVILLLIQQVCNAARYQIDGEFNGCEHGKVYPLLGGGILECQEYNYFYEYSPEVRTDGREVITIGSTKISGVIHDGSVIRTRVKDTFEGCDYDKRIELDNSLVFVCRTYRYSYAYRPEVLIVAISGRSPQVYIRGEKYNGVLYRR
jgi:hypothetical protein